MLRVSLVFHTKAPLIDLNYVNYDLRSILLDHSSIVLHIELQQPTWASVSHSRYSYSINTMLCLLKVNKKTIELNVHTPSHYCLHLLPVS